MSDIGARKTEHLDIVLRGGVAGAGGCTGLDRVRFEHVAAPELDLDAIDLSAAFLGRRLKAPFLISSMTGGPERAEAINLALAETAGALGIAFGVGSQRIALECGASGGLTRSLRQRAGDVPILANLGAAQIRDASGLALARAAADMIEADALIIHLNPLQEAVQAGGDRDWTGVLAAIARTVAALPVPVIVKEVGCGISGTMALRLRDCGVAIIDVAGSGGTSWAAVEAERAVTARGKALAGAFRDWGIPTADAILAVRAAYPAATVIASGGLKSGIDAARALRLGADLAGFAAGILPSAIAGTDSLIARFETLIEELRVVCFCTGSGDLAALKSARLIGDGAPCVSTAPPGLSLRR